MIHYISVASVCDLLTIIIKLYINILIMRNKLDISGVEKLFRHRFTTVMALRDDRFPILYPARILQQYFCTPAI